MAELKILYPGPVSGQFANRDVEWIVQESYYSACADEAAFLIESRCEAEQPEARTRGLTGFSAPRTEPTLPHQWGTDEEVHVCHKEEFKTGFSEINDVEKRTQNPETNCEHSFCDPDLSDEDFTAEEPEKSADYSFICAVTFLVTGMFLVVVSYIVPRDVKVSPDSVSAREMERLALKNAWVSAHLDRCVIAGLCLLTLGGAVLSTLLMISLYKSELVRRQAFARYKHSAKLYGSINFRGAGKQTIVPSHLSLNEDDAVEIEISS